MTSKKEYIPSTSEVKILYTISLLNEKSLYPNSYGVRAILNGDLEYSSYSDIKTFGTSISFGSKFISKSIVYLIRHNYLERIYDKETNELYLKVSDKGTVFLLNYFKKHRLNLKRKKQIKKPTIVKIENK